MIVSMALAPTLADHPQTAAALRADAPAEHVLIVVGADTFSKAVDCLRDSLRLADEVQAVATPSGHLTSLLVAWRELALTVLADAEPAFAKSFRVPKPLAGRSMGTTMYTRRRPSSGHMHHLKRPARGSRI